MKRFAMAAGLVMLASTCANAQTTEQLVKGATDTSNVLNYGMGYHLQRFSTLNQINKDTVKNLVPIWNYSFNDDRSEESQPIVYQGVIYVTSHNATMAVDAKTGKQIWKSKIEYPAETPRIVCCGIINRGVAIHEGFPSGCGATSPWHRVLLKQPAGVPAGAGGLGGGIGEFAPFRWHCAQTAAFPVAVLSWRYVSSGSQAFGCGAGE